MNMMLMKIKQFRSNDQSGMASFLVVTVIVTLLALVSVGFSHLADREARQALDRQLSDEAYYAAESGLNDARNYVANAAANGTTAASVTTCQLPNASPNPFANNGNLSSNGVIRYSCVLIDTQPKELIYELQAGQSISFPVSLNTLANLYFSWENQSYTGAKQPLGSSGQYPQENSRYLGQNATGLLRVGIYPVLSSAQARGHDTNADLAGASRVYFMYPNAAPGGGRGGGGGGRGGGGSITSVDYRRNNGSVVNGNCSDTTHPTLPDPSATPRYCNTEVTGLTGTANYFYVSLTAQYKPLIISIQAQSNGASNNLLSIPNVEAKIDSTGAGNDVLRRIQAIVPLQLNTTNPNYGIQSMQAVCRLFRIPVTSQGHYDTPYLDSSAPNSDNMCLVPSFDSGGIVGGGSP